MSNSDLQEGIHYYINKQGLLVFTQQYLLERGYCCGNGCKHCPYGCKKGRTLPVTKSNTDILK